MSQNMFQKFSVLKIITDSKHSQPVTHLANPQAKLWPALLLTGMVLMGGTGLSAIAQTPPPLTQTFPALQGVTLTPSQQTQLRALSQQLLPQVRAVLTPEQQQQFTAALKQGTGVRGALSSLSLSMGQKMQLRQQLQASKKQLEQILTPAQRQQIRNNISSFNQP
jgi:periplasmic protein CpxP/Spy